MEANNKGIDQTKMKEGSRSVETPQPELYTSWSIRHRSQFIPGELTACILLCEINAFDLKTSCFILDLGLNL